VARRTAAAHAVSAVLLGGSLGYLAPLDTLIRTANQQAYPDVLPGQVLLADRYSITFPTPAALCGERLRSPRRSARSNSVYCFTTDLLHGKQNMQSQFRGQSRWKHDVFVMLGAHEDSPAFHGKPRGFRHRRGTRAGRVEWTGSRSDTRSRL
jgi:hypothetical protein